MTAKKVAGYPLFVPVSLFSLCLFVFCVANCLAADPCRSGLQSGQRPGPYSALIATGQERGQSVCYICEAGERPAVVIFARSLTDSLGKLVRHLDKAVAAHKAADLRAWVTFLSDDQAALDPKVVAWGRQHAIANVPLGIFEDAEGPPSYRLAADADVTVLCFVRQKVVANFAFRTGELTDDRADEVLNSLPRVVAGK